jgi:lipopolysaccharide transport system ATP-binding protein
MKDVTREGRTVVFVSHNLVAMRSLCPRALVLEQGGLVFDGPTDEAVHRYLGQHGQVSAGTVEEDELQLRLATSHVFGEGPALRCTRVAVLDERGVPTTSFRSDEEITFEIEYTVLRQISGLRLFVTLTDENQATVLRTESIDDAGVDGPPVFEPGSYRSEVVLPRHLLGDARLDLNVSLISELNQVLDYAGVVQLDVRFAGLGSNMRGKAYLRPSLPWRTETVEPAQAARAR